MLKNLVEVKSGHYSWEEYCDTEGCGVRIRSSKHISSYKPNELSKDYCVQCNFEKRMLSETKS